METREIAIRDVFGTERSTTLYVGEYAGLDGFACPFCRSVSLVRKAGDVPACENGWCYANPQFTLARALDYAHDQALVEKERLSQAELAKWRLEYARERQANLDADYQARIQTAKDKGACWRCAVKDMYRVARYTKHRTGHPHLN